MRKLFFAFIALSLLPLNSCDDGDVITVELDFDDTFQVCESGDDLVFYKTKSDPSESLSLKVTGLSVDEILVVDENGIYENTITITDNNPFNYRTYSNTTLNDLFCNAIPNSEIKLTEDIEANSGTAFLKTVLTEDDNDGIPAELEDINGDGNLENDDTDGDGLPNYIDADDDGDNILTKDENPDPDNNGIFDDAQDTDEDGIPDYLDKDDDGDLIDTRDEENDSQDNNPANDITNSEIGPDYLNKDVAEDGTPPATSFREHTIYQTFKVTLVIENVDLTLISLDFFNFGTLNNNALSTNRKVTPDFN
ncbi:hypothetical protein GSB9_00816 [Flavobacteriaceae bacterium GSB9]|nr:hypothetical protein GSB9_00816 [Flavobacteriaceae bacterium GSB9]